MVGIVIVDHRQRVPFHGMFAEEVYSGHYLCERRRVGTVAAVLVVEAFRPVYGHAYEPPLVVEKFGPLVGEQGAVGLDAIVDGAAAAILLLQLDGAFIKRYGAQKGFPAVPREKHFGSGLRLKI